MNILADIFSPSWSKPLVWTLLHSLWQGLLILSVLIFLLRLIPTRKSSLRYLITTASLSLILVCSVVTYFYVSSGSGAVSQSNISTAAEGMSGTFVASTESPDFFSAAKSMIENNIYLITMIWMSGTFLFSIRIATGFVYISMMKKNSMLIEDEWNDRLQRLAEQIDLKRIVRLAESTQIQVPIVVGNLKPLILIPAGMTSGLSVEQLESILVHELMHIKRNDYIVNIIQTFVEALFFFNPFVWIVSSIIRREREHCCDDEVVKHGSALAYARALTQLEELKLSNRSLVLSLAENKNQLLKRIKRIMEKSVQSYSVKERMIPVVLLVIGLICASWLTIKSPSGDDVTQESKKTVPSDTTKPGYYRKSVIVRDREGNPMEVIEESINESVDGTLDDDEMIAFRAWSNRDEFDVPPVPPVMAVAPMEFDVPFVEAPEMFEIAEFPEMTEIPAIGAMPEIASVPDMYYVFNDTVPARNYTMRIKGDWGVKEFEVKLKEKFGDFYDKNSEEIQQMMREISKELESKAEKEWAEKALIEVRVNEEMIKAQMDHQRVAMRDQAEAMHSAQANLRIAQREMEMSRVTMQKDMKIVEEKMKAFDEALKTELIKDGYLGKDEEVKTMNWSDDDVVTVNGKKIKESDQKKYRELQRKFFKRTGQFGRPE